MNKRELRREFLNILDLASGAWQLEWVYDAARIYLRKNHDVFIAISLICHRVEYRCKGNLVYQFQLRPWNFYCLMTYLKERRKQEKEGKWLLDQLEFLELAKKP